MQETPVWFLSWEDALEKDRLPTPVFLGFSGGSDKGKESTCNVGDLCSIPGLGGSPGGGHGNPLRILAWRIPWTAEPGGVRFMGLQRVGHGWATKRSLAAVWKRTQDGARELKWNGICFQGLERLECKGVAWGWRVFPRDGCPEGGGASTPLCPLLPPWLSSGSLSTALHRLSALVPVLRPPKPVEEAGQLWAEDGEKGRRRLWRAEKGLSRLFPRGQRLSRGVASKSLPPGGRGHSRGRGAGAATLGEQRSRLPMGPFLISWLIRLCRVFVAAHGTRDPLLWLVGSEGDGWMASPARWTWAWACSGRCEGRRSLACCSPRGRRVRHG